MGFSVSPRSGCDQGALQRELDAERIGAAVCVRNISPGVDSALLLLPGGQTRVFRRAGGVDPRVFAFRVAEEARASLVLATGEGPENKHHRGTVREISKGPAVPEPLRSSLELSLGGALDGGPGGLDWAARGMARVSWWMSDRLGFSAVGAFPLHAQSVNADGASADVWGGAILGGPSLRGRPSKWLQLDISLLLGGGLVVMRGEASAPRESSTETVFPLLLGGGGGANVLFGEVFFVRLDGVVHANTPKLEVVFGERTVASRAYSAKMGLGFGVVWP